MELHHTNTVLNVKSETHQEGDMKNTANSFIEGLKAGDRNSYKNLFDKYYEPLSRFCMRFIADQDDAEEIVQDVFVSLWEKREQITITTSLNAYLFRAVRNKALNHKNHLTIKQAYNEHIQYTSEQVSDNDILFEQELNVMYETALMNMPEKRRQVFEMSRKEGLKYAEISDKLSISVKTVEAHLSKALDELREKLKDYL